ncbi:MAG: hypothetical protein H6658_19430 [Ardenticatenaceae bacterium]|nr:hypothetical protein [Anaerolineales bacterium]MCB8945924.1 hypothetical protein [Ardenticatenaceae bacterium]
MSEQTIKIYLEIGKKKTFAGAVAWPGWCRVGRNEETAVQALLDYGERYAHILQAGGISFTPPPDMSAFAIVERLEGGSTTDFGAPEAMPSQDSEPLTEADLAELRPLLQACWQGFDTAVHTATGQQLRTGPRGGGRDLDKIVDHILQADAAYLRKLAWKHKVDSQANLLAEHQRLRSAILEALTAATRGELPEQGPRGGQLWPPRYFIRRSLWHLLDHLWEIEDRVLG